MTDDEARAERNGDDRIGGERTGGDRIGGERTGGERIGGERTGGDGIGGDRIGGDRTGDRTKDEKAVAALFASLVEGSPGSQLSPLEVVRLGRIEQRGAVDTRARRVKVVRNLLVAAVLVGAVVLVLPRLFAGSSAETASASASTSPTSSASAPVAAAAPDAGRSYGSDGSSTAGSSAAMSAAGSSAASSGPMASSVMSAGSTSAGSTSAGSASAGSTSAGASTSGSVASGSPAPVASNRPTAGAGPGGGAASRRAPSGPASSGGPAARPSPTGPRHPDVPVSTVPRTSGADGCRSLSASAIQAARSAFPAGSFDAPVVCTSTGVVLPSSVEASSSVALDVRKDRPAACLRPDHGPPCSRTASPDVFTLTSSGSTEDILVYGRGEEVHLRVSGSPDEVNTDQLIAAGRAVIMALG